MRVLFANDGAADAGGVQTYLEAVGGGLRDRGHEVGYLFCNESSGNELASFATRQINLARLGQQCAFDAAREFQPDVVYSHNMALLDVEGGLVERFPVVKFMHGYFGTCISGLKMHALPTARPCCRSFSAACLALYLPRRCGRMNVRVMARQYRWATAQRRLFPEYRAVVVGSEHMGREYSANGVPEAKIHVNPLFAPDVDDDSDLRIDSPIPSLLFLGRMTKLKGGDLLLRAVGLLKTRGFTPLSIVMAGDGPQRLAWERLARRLSLRVQFPGWLNAVQRSEALRRATLLVVSSVWPEPFGLLGLEAAQRSVPAVAFDVGGVREWLVPGVTGCLAPGSPPTAAGLAETIITALSDRQRLQDWGEAAKRRAAEMSLSAHLERLEQIFSAVREPHYVSA